MYKITVVNLCACAKKRKAWSKELVFDTMEAANEHAQKMVIQGNEKFCKRHSFSLTTNGNVLQIHTSSK